MATRRLLPSISLLFVFLCGCWAVEGDPAYDLTQGCYTLTSVTGGASVRADDGGAYSFTSGGGPAADRFFLKPTGLGTYLLYDQQGGFLASKGETLSRLEEGDTRGEWAIHELDVLAEATGLFGRTPQYSLRLTAKNLLLVTTDTGPALYPKSGDGIGSPAAWLLEKQPSEGCMAFPEAALDAVVSAEFDEPRDSGEPVVGFADLHTHIAFPKSIGALAMAGGIVHRFGIQHALADCDGVHGPNGSLDLLGSQTGSGGHDTTGFPTFTDWPTRHSTTHIQAYYRWIERAYLSGLRLVVTDATGNRPLCQVLADLFQGNLEGDCSPASTVELQSRYIYEIQDYIDAQEGGPGEGWFRVVLSPAEAREVIAANKLAVVIGVEYGELFDCHPGDPLCTEEFVDAELQKLHDLGVRSLFPIHRFDNAFGGTRIADGDAGAWMNLANKISTTGVLHYNDLVGGEFQGGGDFWQVAECDEGINGVGGVRDMADFSDVLPSINPIFELFESAGFFEALAPIPDYAEVDETPRICNPRSLQELGVYLLERMMALGMIIEIDHLSPETLLATLDVLEEHQYSGFVSSHSWLENQPAIRDRIFALGGLMSPFNGSPSNIASTIATYADEMSEHPYPVGVPIGSDIQGVASQASGDGDKTTTYPFTSWDGLVTFHAPKTGDRSFDFDQEGLAHYGLLPEWVEQLRQVDEEHPAEIMAAFMNSAEAYVSMWERAEASAE